MAIFNHIPAWLKNKYVLCILGLAVWMLFFDDRDILTTYYRQRSELRTLQASKAYYQAQIDQTRSELEQLKVNAAVVEKYARERYLMKRDNEDLFLVQPPAAQP